MTALSAAQLYALAREAGLSPVSATTAAAVALAESGGRTDAIGDVALEDGTWGPSVGPWQIRSQKAQYGTGGPRDASRLTDPAFNARSMASISGSGKNFGPWTTYTKGLYRKFLGQAAPAAASDVAGNPLADVSAVTDPAGAAGLAGVAPGGSAALAAGNALASLTSGWGGDALKIGLYVIGGLTAAGLVIAGAVQTVK